MFLAVLFVIGTCSMTIAAADTSTGTTDAPSSGTVSEKVSYTYYTISSSDPSDATVNYFVNKDIEWLEADVFDTPAEKLNTMDLRLQQNGYQLYVDEYSGEVACKNLTTQEILFTNPYNIGSSTAKGNQLNQLMSQILVEYTDKTTGVTTTFTSFAETALRGQLKVKNIKNGLRVEYTIGREEAKMLVPRLIEKTRFETKIKAVIEEALKSEGEVGQLKIDKVITWYKLYDISQATNDVIYDSMVATFPITKKMPVYSIDDKISSTQLAAVEMLIKTYIPSYTYEDLDHDHELTEYEGEEQNPPLFKMALEYILSSEGLSVTLPANGLRFDESRYTLENITVLPYMGAAKSPNEGYTFFPDGSGALFDFEELRKLSSTNISGQVYGVDYAYQTITATHQETIRYPVFGIVETQQLTKLAPDQTIREYEQDRGFVAIITEGDSMAKLTTSHGGKTTHEFHSVQMTYFPRPKDSYNLKDAISSTSNSGGAMWEVVSSRKYTGNYTVKYVMLTDEDVAKQIQHDMGEGGSFEYYECSYMGMASAYRKYLEDINVLTPLTEEDVSDDIPLYINTFGAIDTTQKIMSIPVDVTVALTSFDDVSKMYADLSSIGIKNVNFKLTGYANGGMSATVPYRLDWEKAVGGKKGFDALLKDANENGYKVFPDFDFVYVSETGMIDGLTLRKHVVKSIDNRYTSRREYSATKQAFVSFFELCLSPAYYEHFYTKLTSNYLKHFKDTDYKTSISVGTLGSELNSDFDESDPYNREDSKKYTIRAFRYFDENYDYVMTSGGNAFTWQYVDYILDVPLDSSRFIRSSASVPFMGIVLHGYVQFAGTPINMEGNPNYAFLKAIENGASVNFILSYQNTTTLKNHQRLSKYYSIRYDIWFEDVVSIYNELNSLLSDVQLETIVDHDFIDALRVPDLDEAIKDLDAAILESIEAEREALNAQTLQNIQTILNARQLIRINSAAVKAEIERLESYKTAMTLKLGYSVDENGNVSYGSGELAQAITNFNAAVQNYIKVYNGGDCGANEITGTSAILGDAARTLNSAAANLQKFFDQAQNGSVNYIAHQAYSSELAARTAYENAMAAYEILANTEGVSEYIRELAWGLIEDTAEAVATIGALAPSIYDMAQGAYEYVVSDTATLTGANGNALCEISTYQFYLYAVCGYLTVQPTVKFEMKNVFRCYEIGLEKNDLTAKAALDQILNTLDIATEAKEPNYSTLFARYLNKKNQVGFETRYNTFMERWATYQEIYTRYKAKKATSTELNTALTPLMNAAIYLNTEFGYFVDLFEASPKSSSEIITFYENTPEFTAQAESFSKAFAACFNSESPSAAELKALSDAAGALSATFDTISDLYAIAPSDSATGINAYAKNAQKHKSVLEIAKNTAASVYETLSKRPLSEGDEGYAERQEALAAAQAYVQYTEENYNAVVEDAEKVIALAEAAYEKAAALDETQKYLAVIEEVNLLAEEDERLFDVAPKFTEILYPYDHIVEEKQDEILEEEEEVYNKYSADKNSIVLVTYSNGTRFLLNYCDYAVVVEIDGISYRVESQSYQKIPVVESEVEDNDQ